MQFLLAVERSKLCCHTVVTPFSWLSRYFSNWIVYQIYLIWINENKNDFLFSEKPWSRTSFYSRQCEWITKRIPLCNKHFRTILFQWLNWAENVWIMKASFYLLLMWAFYISHYICYELFCVAFSNGLLITPNVLVIFCQMVNSIHVQLIFLIYRLHNSTSLPSIQK